MTAGDPDPVPVKIGQVGRVYLARVEVLNLNPCRTFGPCLVEGVNVASPRRRPPELVNRRAQSLLEGIALDAADYRLTVGPVDWYAI